MTAKGAQEVRAGRTVAAMCARCAAIPARGVRAICLGLALLVAGSPPFLRGGRSRAGPADPAHRTGEFCRREQHRLREPVTGRTSSRSRSHGLSSGRSPPYLPRGGLTSSLSCASTFRRLRFRSPGGPARRVCIAAASVRRDRVGIGRGPGPLAETSSCDPPATLRRRRRLSRSSAAPARPPEAGAVVGAAASGRRPGPRPRRCPCHRGRGPARAGSVAPRGRSWGCSSKPCSGPPIARSRPAADRRARRCRASGASARCGSPFSSRSGSSRRWRFSTRAGHSMRWPALPLEPLGPCRGRQSLVARRGGAAVDVGDPIHADVVSDRDPLPVLEAELGEQGGGRVELLVLARLGPGGPRDHDVLHRLLQLSATRGDARGGFQIICVAYGRCHDPDRHLRVASRQVLALAPRDTLGGGRWLRVVLGGVVGHWPPVFAHDA